MTGAQKPRIPEVARLQATVQELSRAVHEFEEERNRLIRQRRRNLLITGGALSLLVHITVMIVLSTIHRPSGRPSAPQPVSFELAVLQEEQLTELEATEFEDLADQAISDLDQVLPDETTELPAEASAPQLEAMRAGAVPTLGGAGQGLTGDGGMGGGGAGTSFFGVASRGSRFAYIVDRSGSMGEQEGQKLNAAMRELARSIEALPDYAHFSIVLFSSGFVEPPMQRGWTRSRRQTVRRFVRWLNEVRAGGGTQPRGAFDQVFALEPLPDVIFFLTDGVISSMSSEYVAGLNGGGRRVVINCIAFGDPGSQDLLRRIASDSGGTYRFVPTSP